MAVADRRVAPGGAEPGLVHDIAAHSGQVKIELHGRTIPVTAAQLHGTEQEEAWRQITATASRFAAYPAQDRPRTADQIIRLTPRSG